MAITQQKTRVLVVDDSSLIRQMFSEMLGSDPEIEVVGVAHDPFMAREKIKQLNPDVITLDIEMPKMDGISFLTKIMTLRPMPVVMCSTLTQRGADITIRALEIGAVDYVSKPTDHITADSLLLLKDELISKVKTAAKAKVDRTQASIRGAHKRPLAFHGDPNRTLVAIGASTGGVEAIRDVLVELPKITPPIVITQHMPPFFTASFANRLNSLCQITVQEAADGDALEPGHAYIAPGGKQMRVHKRGTGRYTCMVEDGELVSGHRPSVDVLFRSVAEQAGESAVAAILTGMGKDGADGLLAIRKAGGHTLGEDPQTCIVYGMPKAAFELGAVEKQVRLPHMAEEIIKLCNARI